MLCGLHEGEIIRYVFGMRWLVALASVMLASACDDPPSLLPAETPVCLREETPTTYEVYFAIDVSGSMGPFLTDVKNELVGFADSLPKFDDQGRSTQVQFFVIAFVNDVRWYPDNVRRLRQVSQVQAAFESAIADGEGNLNLNTATSNAETQENLLDALKAVVDNHPAADANLVLLATDAGFAEAPDELSGKVKVQSTYPAILSGLEAASVRVHAFARPGTDGLTRGYAGHPALTSLPGSTQHDITSLVGARAQIRETLTVIAESADCN